MYRTGKTHLRFKGSLKVRAKTQAQKLSQLRDDFLSGVCHTALLSAIMLSPVTMPGRTPAVEISQTTVVADSAVPASVPESTAASSCPNFTGLRKYVCYGPCCGIPWGPGGPICLALAGGAFRTALPFRYSSWLLSKEGDPDLPPVDKGVLAFSAALFLGSAPLTFAGVSVSFAFVVACLL